MFNFQRPFFAVLMVPFGAAALTASEANFTAERIEPVVFLRDGEIASCGIAATALRGTERASASLALERDPSAADGAYFAFSASWTRDGHSAHVIQNVAFSVADNVTASAGVRPEAGGIARGITERSSTDGGLLFRNLMISGGRVTLDAMGGARAVITIAGPVPQSVRSAYLNCAGDLFRPE